MFGITDNGKVSKYNFSFAMSFRNSKGEKVVVGLHSHLSKFGIAPRFDFSVPRYLRFVDVVWVSLKPGFFFGRLWDVGCEAIPFCQHYFPALTKLAPAFASCHLKFTFGVNPRAFGNRFRSFAAMLAYFDTQLLPLIQTDPAVLKIEPGYCENGEEMGERLIVPLLALPRVMRLNAVEFELPMIETETENGRNTLRVPIDAILNWLIVDEQHERKLSIRALSSIFLPSILSDLEQLEERIKSVFLFFIILHIL